MQFCSKLLTCSTLNVKCYINISYQPQIKINEQFHQQICICQTIIATQVNIKAVISQYL